MIRWQRQSNGTFARSGELPPGTTRVRVLIVDRPARHGDPQPTYAPEYAIAMLERGPLKYDEYQIVPAPIEEKVLTDAERTRWAQRAADRAQEAAQPQRQKTKFQLAAEKAVATRRARLAAKGKETKCQTGSGLSP